MKLIVLYGDENSGKTITLKMVYERLKKHNLLDTRWFKYYDSDGTHRDFRDVLVLNTTRVVQSTSAAASSVQVVQCDGNSIADVKSAFSDADFELLEDFDGDISGVNESEVSFDNDYDETEKGDQSYNDEMNGETTSVMNNNLESSYVQDINGTLKAISANGVGAMSVVGFVLEGDYGFSHAKTRSTTTHHSRSLYDHLHELEFCNTLICACSKPKAVTSVIMKPVNCVVKFIMDYAAKYGSISVFKVDSNASSGTSWGTKNSIDAMIANKIVTLI